MRNIKEKRIWKNVIQSKPVLVFLGALVLIFSWSVFGFLNKMMETSRNKRIVEEKVASLKTQKEKLLSDINNLNTEEGKEKFFRENFGLAKEGEDMIVVVEDKNPPKTQNNDTNNGFFSFLINWFK